MDLYIPKTAQSISIICTIIKITLMNMNMFVIVVIEIGSCGSRIFYRHDVDDQKSKANFNNSASLQHKASS